MRRRPPTYGESAHRQLECSLLKAHAEDRRVVLIVDEAQTLSPELLEQVRLLTNLETAKQKLLQIILIGQPELRDILDRPRCGRSRSASPGAITWSRCRGRHAAYVAIEWGRRLPNRRVHRAAVDALYRQSRGIPRLINVIADRALLAAYTAIAPADGSRVARAAAEVFGGRRRAPLVADRGRHRALRLRARDTNSGNGRRSGPEPARRAVLAPCRRRRCTRSRSGDRIRPRSRCARRESRGAADARRRFCETRASQRTPTPRSRELFALWDAAYDPARGDPAHRRRSTGCVPLSAARHARRAAAHELAGDTVAGRRATGSGASGRRRRARIRPGATRRERQEFELPLAEISYSLVRRSSPAVAPGRCAGARPGAWRRRRRRALAARYAREARGEPAPSDRRSTFYDDALEQRVRAYQRAHQLTVDGIVGARTQIAMLAELGLPDTPALVKDH